MSTSRRDYVMWAVNIGYDKVDYDDNEDVIEGLDGAPFDMVYDGMSGNYVFAGKIIAESDEFEGFPVVELARPYADLDKTAIATAVAERFPFIKPTQFQIIVFTHWT